MMHAEQSYLNRDYSRQVEQKPGGRGRGREYNNLPFKMHCDSIITRSCWIGLSQTKSLSPSFPLTDITHHSPRRMLLKSST